MSDKFVTHWPAQVGIPQSAPVAVAKLAEILAWHAGEDLKKVEALVSWYEMVARAIREDQPERSSEEAWLALEGSLATALTDGIAYGNWPWEK